MPTRMRLLLAVVVGSTVLCGFAGADDVLIQGRLTQEGANFVVTDEQGQRTVFTEIWKPHKISAALGKDRPYWFRVQRAGRAPNYRLRLMEAYASKPAIGQEQVEDLRHQHEALLEEKIKRVAAERASYRWEPGKINSSRGVWTRSGQTFTLNTTVGPGAKRDREIVGGRLVPDDGRQHPTRPAELRKQVVTIDFADAGAAERSYLQPLPLYGGHLGALTCRWDDSDKRSDLLVSQVGAEQQVYGTCFLNGLDGALHQGKSNQLDRQSIRAILNNGSAIGNHSYTHPAAFTLRSPNRQFWEAMHCRAQWEALGDCLISTVAPPYNRYGDERSIDLWLRSGHIGFINNAGRIVERYGYADLVCDQALMVYGTHARSEGRTLEAVREKAGTIWAKIHEDRRLWSPNFNRFAAYRFQYEHTGIEKEVDGRTATFALHRPALVDLNDPVPLTLVVGGVAPSVIKGISAGGAAVQRLDKTPMGDAVSAGMFHLGHGTDQFLPQAIGLIENAGNAKNLADVKPDGDFPGLHAIVYEQESKLHVKIDNRSDRPLRDVSLTYRIPHGWNREVVRRRGLTVAEGQAAEDVLTIARVTNDDETLRGRPWFYVQVDFRHGDVPGRLHLASRSAALAPDPHRPAGHFVAAGPLRQILEKPGAVPDPAVLGPFGDKLLQQAREGQIRDWRMNDDGETYIPDFIQVTPVAANDENYPPQRRDQLDWYLARAAVESDSEQTVYIRTSAAHLMLNGQSVKPRSAHQDLLFTAKLSRGENELVVALPLGIRNITDPHGFAFVVLARPDPSGSEPARGIRFRTP